MTKEMWLNFPVKDLGKTKEFFSRIGFSLNEQHTSGEMVCFSVGEKKMTVAFFAEETFRGFTKSEISDARAGAEVLISFDAESREEVDETARKVFEAGGAIFSEPAEIQGWMYGCGFADLDEHRWNVLYMDFSKMPKQ
jgi:predicted lactoylglutathione lyase